MSQFCMELVMPSLSFYRLFFICMGKKNNVNLCLKTKVKPFMERRECPRWTDSTGTVLPVSPLRSSFSLMRAMAQGSEGKRDDWPSFSSCRNYLFLVFRFCFVLFSLACNLSRFCQVHSHIVCLCICCMRITRNPFKVVK